MQKLVLPVLTQPDRFRERQRICWNAPLGRRSINERCFTIEIYAPLLSSVILSKFREID